ncbi:TetR/AcrR family transcriptional regulator [Glaciibacter flavus]|uniref:TetR/AcrR family transcriptional regulator n=1 Tax=Orlajensenia flava TaxID=2565934 RepID=UPI003B00B95D
MDVVATPGRRERKKAATRGLIVTAARALFLERGFEAVSVREIADRADVSPTTVFAHFSQKEAILFDEDELHDALVAAVRDRAEGVSISRALQSHYLREIAALRSGSQQELFELMESTPALIAYAERMWFRHEGALADVITEEFGLTEPSDEIRMYVRFALQIQLTATHSEDPISAIDAGFRILDEGWTGHQHDAPAATSELQP